MEALPFPQVLKFATVQEWWMTLLLFCVLVVKIYGGVLIRNRPLLFFDRLFN
jgi:hypothetical protein